MNETEKDLVAVLLKIVRSNGLISEATYQGALNKLICTFDVGTPVNYDSNIKGKGSAMYGYSESTG